MKGRLLAFTLIGAGLLLLSATGAYYGYAHVARLGLDELTVVMERPSPVVVARQAAVAGTSPTSAGAVVPRASAEATNGMTAAGGTVDEDAAEEPASVVGVPDAKSVSPTRPTDGGAASPPAAATQPVGQVSVSESPGQVAPAGKPVSGALSPLQESDLRDRDAVAVSAPASDAGGGETAVQAPPAAPETPSRGNAASSGTRAQDAGETEVAALFRMLPGAPAAERFTFLELTPDLLPDNPAKATRIYIPALGLESEIQELGLLVKGDRLEWETPKWVVGHVPVTGRPGVSREGWYFGHLQSPLRREGNVFRRLPEIPPLLKHGETVQIVLETEDRRYLYQVYKTEVVYQDDLAITISREQDITLVTCYPTLVYDHRLLVTAALVGVTES